MDTLRKGSYAIVSTCYERGRLPPAKWLRQFQIKHTQAQYVDKRGKVVNTQYRVSFIINGIDMRLTHATRLKLITSTTWPTHIR